MTIDAKKKILQKLLYGIHIGFGVIAIIVIKYFGSPETRNLFLGSTIGFILSALLLLLMYRKTLNGVIRRYLIFICLLPILYLGIWIILGLLMMH